MLPSSPGESAKPPPPPPPLPFRAKKDRGTRAAVCVRASNYLGKRRRSRYGRDFTDSLDECCANTRAVNHAVRYISFLSITHRWRDYPNISAMRDATSELFEIFFVAFFAFFFFLIIKMYAISASSKEEKKKAKKGSERRDVSFARHANRTNGIREIRDDRDQISGQFLGYEKSIGRMQLIPQRAATLCTSRGTIHNNARPLITIRA